MRIKKDELTELLGYEAGKGMKLMILQEIKETGKSIQEVAAKHNLGTMAILDDDCKFEYNGTKVTPDEWRKINPLGEYGKLIIIGTAEDLARLAKFRAKQETEKQ